MRCFSSCSLYRKMRLIMSCIQATSAVVPDGAMPKWRRHGAHLERSVRINGANAGDVRIWSYAGHSHQRCTLVSARPVSHMTQMSEEGLGGLPESEELPS
eukprot:TRINITY_DN9383_c0_g2_i11.p4 TRINITY_DN9383_c0_g2~~TRINITY_DN9383_c0_g2_i11.p4  ORF type:complete len:100 (-),score=0.72 TRINITY_DN9383_c0_g2_i11:1244-1543(-)